MRRRWKRRLLWATALTVLLVLAIPATVAQASVAVRSVVERRGIMRKLIPLAALLALAAIIGSGTLASASSTGGAQTLTLVAVDLPKTERYVDVGAKGDSPGDTIFFREMLIQNAKKVGGSEVMCVFWVGNAGRCHGTLRLGAKHARGEWRHPLRRHVQPAGGGGHRELRRRPRRSPRDCRH